MIYADMINWLVLFKDQNVSYFLEVNTDKMK